MATVHKEKTEVIMDGEEAEGLASTPRGGREWGRGADRPPLACTLYMHRPTGPLLALPLLPPPPPSPLTPGQVVEPKKAIVDTDVKTAEAAAAAANAIKTE